MKNTIKKQLTQEEFEAVCRKNKVTNSLEISRRWSNYLKFVSNGLWDRTANEVGATIKNIEDED